MYAAVVEQPGQLAVKQIPKPIPGKGEFLIQVLASSICNATDNHIVEGIFDGYHDHYPQTLGHEVCGRVVELGEGVTDVRLGGWRCTPPTAPSPNMCWSTSTAALPGCRTT